jgi:hypothetical protein
MHHYVLIVALALIDESCFITQMGRGNLDSYFTWPRGGADVSTPPCPGEQFG